MSRLTHGKSKTKIYGIWSSMLSRCRNPNNPAYSNYGARGISVCDEWNDFSTFYRDMGDRPHGMTLDRKDNNQGYCKENCRWAPRQVQARNRRGRRVVTACGTTKSLAEWSDETKISISTLSARLAEGWTPEAAVTTPLITKRAGIPRGEKLRNFQTYGSQHGVVWTEPMEEEIPA